MTKLIYKKECYEIVGCCFEVFNQLGSGLREKNYQNAIERVMDARGIEYEGQAYVPIKIDEVLVGKHFIDILVNKKSPLS